MTEDHHFKWSSGSLCICLYLGLYPRPLWSYASVLPARPQRQMHTNYYTSSVNTRCTLAIKEIYDVPTFNPLIHKPKFHFDESFANDGPRLWKSLPLAVNLSPHCHLSGVSLRLTCIMKPIAHSILFSGCANAFLSLSCTPYHLVFVLQSASQWQTTTSFPTRGPDANS